MDEFEKKITLIRGAMEYTAPPESMDEALDLLEIYKEDKLALDLLHEYYSFPPEVGANYVREIRLLGRQRGILLLAAITAHSGYIYLVSSEGIEFHGSLEEGIWDRELLDFFALKKPVDQRQGIFTSDHYPLYEPMNSDSEICPACHAETGEYHELGCPVELCPWCGGQLIHCDCRFEKLGVDILEETDLVRLEQLLEEQGRIPYTPEQRPSFPQFDE
jgi:hypothetical protein